MTNTPQDIRGIVLGWGEGARLKEFARECLGSEAPKQFYAFLGHRTRLQHGVHRAAMLIPQIRVVVATEHHRRYVEGGLEPACLDSSCSNQISGTRLLASFSPWRTVLHLDTYADVAVLPSGHSVQPGWRFMQAVA
ncbi:MAG: hypothetical protein KGJ82_12175 [Nitrospirota bacterium]|nr:hypothetical protein [Nitrospirota bacterium]